MMTNAAMSAVQEERRSQELLRRVAEESSSSGVEKDDVEEDVEEDDVDGDDVEEDDAEEDYADDEDDDADAVTSSQEATERGEIRGTVISCPTCHREFNTRQHLADHLSRKKPCYPTELQDLKFSCDKCRKRFKHQSSACRCRGRCIRKLRRSGSSS